jgi:hypothetical protein
VVVDGLTEEKLVAIRDNLTSLAGILRQTLRGTALRALASQIPVERVTSTNINNQESCEGLKHTY